MIVHCSLVFTNSFSLRFLKMLQYTARIRVEVILLRREETGLEVIHEWSIGHEKRSHLPILCGLPSGHAVISHAAFKHGHTLAVGNTNFQTWSVEWTFDCNGFRAGFCSIVVSSDHLGWLCPLFVSKRRNLDRNVVDEDELIRLSRHWE